MNTRDYFAGLAMQAIMNKNKNMKYDDIAEGAYLAAEAMMRRRKTEREVDDGTLLRDKHMPEIQQTGNSPVVYPTITT
jgi:hypothetical protein